MPIYMKYDGIAGDVLKELVNENKISMGVSGKLCN